MVGSEMGFRVQQHASELWASLLRMRACGNDVWDCPDNGTRLAWSMTLRQLMLTTDPVLDPMQSLHTHVQSKTVVSLIHGQPLKGTANLTRCKCVENFESSGSMGLHIADGCALACIHSEPPCTPACDPMTREHPVCITHNHTDGLREAALKADPPAAGP